MLLSALLALLIADGAAERMLLAAAAPELIAPPAALLALLTGLLPHAVMTVAIAATPAIVALVRKVFAGTATALCPLHSVRSPVTVSGCCV
jgi:hypothetical protein